MKNHTPQKRHPAIVSFSKDHHFGLLMVWKIRHGLNKAVDAGRIGNYVLFFFKEDLEKHFIEEEQLLFSKLPADDVLRKQAESDHQAIYKLVTNIEKKKDDAVLLNQLADELEKHIRFEERELFNHLQNNISAEDLALLENRFSNNSKDIDEKWEDVFWEGKKNIALASNITSVKKILTLVLATGFLLACNAGNEKEKNTITEPAAENHVEHAEHATGLVLNNGLKWKADSATLMNVALLQNIVSISKKESLENYIQTATALQDGLNKMVSECKMKGADHEALHHWLEPLMEKTKELKQATIVQIAAVSFNKIEKQTELFSKYFE